MNQAHIQFGPAQSTQCPPGGQLALFDAPARQNPQNVRFPQPNGLARADSLPRDHMEIAQQLASMAKSRRGPKRLGDAICEHLIAALREQVAAETQIPSI